jgi:MinD-like ATPase involved in chromosome partitioning or flagellar assembly
MISKVPVLVAASGAGWETRALEELATSGPLVVLLKRCVDLHDLLASATTGEARVALVSASLPGLDLDSVSRLREAGVATVIVTAGPDPSADEREHARRLGVEQVVPGSALEGLEEVVLLAGAEAAATSAPSSLTADSAEDTAEERGTGRLVVVWGPAGSPGRTTLSVNLAAELAHRGKSTLLLDADPYGGAVAQHLGILDEVSGILAAARLANAGRLDGDRLEAIARLAGPGLRVLTGLPRADRWNEVRERAFTNLLDLVRRAEPYAVVDTGFSLEKGPGDPFVVSTPERNGMTLTALGSADELLVVGSADPVGLARLARGLVDLLEAAPPCPVRVVVNRTRPSLGWAERDVRQMVEGFTTPASVHFLPDDRAAADRALMAGRSLVETGDSALRRAVALVADAVAGSRTGERRMWRRTRPNTRGSTRGRTRASTARAGTGHPGRAQAPNIR